MSVSSIDHICKALHALAEDISSNYLLGNKSTARAMFNNVPDRRKAYVTACLADMLPASYIFHTFIKSVTE